MLLTVAVLFICTLLGGLSIHLVPEINRNLKLPLIFGGSYLFAITIIHIIPELFEISSNPSLVGLYILLGFFLQQFLEYFSSGVEHGHVHGKESLSLGSRFSLVTALFIHSLLEGALLTHDSPFHEEHESYSLLLGVILHKMPAAFALMATMQGMGRKAIYVLLLFSLASPAGLIISDLVLFSESTLMFVFALVGGSFLHISTTIFVETSPEHHFGFKKNFISASGALLAIVVEYVV
ncbi:MAG: zinc permease [Ekhidna sp.]|nr:zinc permease [Ekhidna sp.]